MASTPGPDQGAQRDNRLASKWVGTHYSGKPLINPAADLSIAGPPAAADLGPCDFDAAKGRARRFNTWSGYPTGPHPDGVTTGDFNNDHAVDVAYARRDGAGRGLTVQLNKGDGTMGAATTYASATNSTDIKAGDLDGDLDLDLAMVGRGRTERDRGVTERPRLRTCTHGRPDSARSGWCKSVLVGAQTRSRRSLA